MNIYLYSYSKHKKQSKTHMNENFDISDCLKCDILPVGKYKQKEM